MAYTTIAYVSAELKGLSITSSTTPSSTQVNQWIDEAEAEIDLRTGRTWESTVATSVVFDHDGSKYFRFPQSPIISVSTLEYESGGLGATSVTWTSLAEGRTSDFILYVNDGEIEFITMPSAGRQNLRATYTYGYSTTPPYITRLATLIVAKRVVEATINASAQSEGGSITVGNISITDPSAFSITNLRSMGSEIEDTFKRVGQHRVFRPARNYSLRGY